MSRTARQIAIGKYLRRYYYARTAQIRNAVVPHDRDGSITREALRSMLALGDVRRHEPRILEQGRTTAPPIWILTQHGSCELAAATGDGSLMLNVEPTFKDWLSLNHYLRAHNPPRDHRRRHRAAGLRETTCAHFRA